MNTGMPAMQMPAAGRSARHAKAALIGRVNQLYHELTQTSFDRDHRRRHRVERPFWRKAARATLGNGARPAPREGRPGRVIVDLACGTGFVTEILAPRLKPCDHLVAIDLSQVAVNTAARKGASSARSAPGRRQVHPLVSDGQTLPLAAGSVDLLALNAALHHLPHPAAVLREIDRVLKPGGYFVLGFEPNRTHFTSPIMAGLSRALSRASWYASPSQNWRRLCERLGLGGHIGEDPGAPDAVAASINDRLIRDGLLCEPLSTDDLLDLVDPHARGADEAAGFDPAVLLAEAMRDYEIHLLISSDYLGETGRELPVVRRAVDAMLRAFLPQHGSLFSWLIRKPVHSARGAS